MEDFTKRRKNEKEMPEAKFKVGDRVYALYRGYGTVTAIYSGTVYPIEVTWDECECEDLAVSTFTKDGRLSQYLDNDDTILTVVEKASLKKKDKKSMSEEADTRVVDRMMDALDKKTEDAINPSHYKVKGISEAHEIINHLMHREQYEGFLWGNIIKYAYRYGRKGDKAETAGKIAWYATKLKELEECEEEKEDD